MTHPQTVVKEQYDMEPFECIGYISGINNAKIQCLIQGLPNERSYEDRDVYFEPRFDACWLRGEDAISLGQALIKHGTRALLANMIRHQHGIHMRQLRVFKDLDIIKELTMTLVDDKPANHGQGYNTYLIKPIWKEGLEPEFEHDFQFETNIYWSPFEEEFQRQLTAWGNPTLIGYDREKDLAEFKKLGDEISGPPTDQVPTISGDIGDPIEQQNENHTSLNDADSNTSGDN